MTASSGEPELPGPDRPPADGKHSPRDDDSNHERQPLVSLFGRNPTSWAYTARIFIVILVFAGTMIATLWLLQGADLEIGPVRITRR